MTTRCTPGRKHGEKKHKEKQHDTKNNTCHCNNIVEEGQVTGVLPDVEGQLAFLLENCESCCESC